MWPYIWIAIMLGLITATVVTALREKKAQAKAKAAMMPQPMDDPAGVEHFGDGFAEPDPVDSFGGGEFGGGELAELDQNSFK